MLKKTILGFLLSNFILFPCSPMDQQLKTNLGQLKDSLVALKTKLGNLQSKLEELKESLADQPYGDQAFTAKKIIIDGQEYCTCEFWNLPKLRNYVKKNSHPFPKPNRAFNVIPRSGQPLSKIVNDQMKSPQYNGAVFQLAANDNVPYVWTGGGSHAGYMVKATQLGNVIRNHPIYKDCKKLNTLFDDPALPKSNGSRVEGCAALGTANASPEDLNNIFVAFH